MTVDQKLEEHNIYDVAQKSPYYNNDSRILSV